MVCVDLEYYFMATCILANCRNTMNSGRTLLEEAVLQALMSVSLSFLWVKEF